ncbi:hypothetical protein ACE04B_39800, partial [Rhizobium phaseoli]
TAGDNAAGIVVVVMVTRGSGLNSRSNKGRRDQQAADNSHHNILLSGTGPRLKGKCGSKALVRSIFAT